MKKILFIISSIIFATSALANQPKDWQLGFQNAASEGMRDIVNFHNNLLLPIIIAISVFVLFLMIYASIRFRASRNPNPSKTTHNVAVEVLWTLIPCLILIVMAVPSFKIYISKTRSQKLKLLSKLLVISGIGDMNIRIFISPIPVSYTHLTLPTIYSV